MATTRKRPPSQPTADERALAHASALVSAFEQDAEAAVREVVALVEQEPPLALAVMAELSRMRQPSAAGALQAIAKAPLAREVRKEARRGLHRLRAAGVQPPERPEAGRPVAPRRPRGVLYEAWATAPDGLGSRALWLLAERPLGGIWAVGLVIDDVVGMKAAQFGETTRKRFQARLERWVEEEETAWVRLPIDYAAQLVGEAVGLNQQSGVAVPTEFQVNREVIEAIERPFQSAPVYQEVSPGAARLAPDWLDNSPRLLGEPELSSWMFQYEGVRPFAEQLREAQGGRLVATPGASRERQEQIISQAIQSVMTPELRRGLKRRLEEVGYICLQTDRLQQARWAVAAATGIEQAMVSPLLLPQASQRLDQHPLLRAMMERTLDLALHLMETGHEQEAVAYGRGETNG